MELWVPYCCAILLMALEILELALFIGLMSVKSFGFCPGYRTLGGMSVSPVVSRPVEHAPKEIPRPR
jgi:hypothetical protein